MRSRENFSRDGRRDSPLPLRRRQKRKKSMKRGGGQTKKKKTCLYTFSNHTALKTFTKKRDRHQMEWETFDAPRRTGAPA